MRDLAVKTMRTVPKQHKLTNVSKPHILKHNLLHMLIQIHKQSLKPFKLSMFPLRNRRMFRNFNHPLSPHNRPVNPPALRV